MAHVLLYPVFRIREHPEFHWCWRTANNKLRSAQGFPLFHECLLDAETKGHTIDMRATLAASQDASRVWRRKHG